MKIVSIVGARPQFIKCAPVSRELRKKHDEVLVHTGQHYDRGMSGIFFEELNIPMPDYNLNVGSGTHGKQTGAMLAGIEEILINERPDIVLVYGDTNSTVAGALAASKLHIKVAHVEAGLRSYDLSMPEEINRILTDHISSILFCPTQTAVNNLEKEGITKGVLLVGDVMADAMEYNRTMAERVSHIVDNLGITKGKYLVVTIHRPGNTDNKSRMADIMGVLGESEEDVIFPAHPRTLKYLKEYDILGNLRKNVKIIEPLGYLDMLMLMSSANKVITDSGGVQKEAYLLKVPCITLRENTEWIETVESGWNDLVDANKGRLLDMIHKPKAEIAHPDIFMRGATKKIVENLIGIT